jgi:hypothetical protein
MFQRTRNYAKDYERVGRTVQYKGKHYRLDMEKPLLNRRKAVYLTLLAVALGVYLAIGLSGAASLGAVGKPAAIYVVLPYILLLLPLGLALARAFLLIIKTKPLEYAEYDKYLVQQRGVLISALVICGCLAAGCIAFLLFGGASGLREIAVFAESLLCGSCIFAAFLQYHALFNCIAIDEPSGVRYDI